MWNQGYVYVLQLTAAVFAVLCSRTLCDGPVSEQRFNLTNEVAVKLIYGETHGIAWTDLTRPVRLTPLLTHVYLDVTGLDYHFRRNWLFYSAWGSIWRLKFNGTVVSGSPEKIVPDAKAQSVAVDWERDLVYWTSVNDSNIQRADLEGGHRETVLQPVNISQHNNIVLDPYKRLLFLATDEARFLRSDLEGQDLRHVKLDGHSGLKVWTLAVDIHQRRLYLSGRQDFQPELLSCTYDGTRIRSFQVTGEWWGSFVSIGVFRNQLFWAHKGWQERDNVWKANITDSDILTWEKEYTIVLSAANIWALKVYHPDFQTPCEEEALLPETTRTVGLPSSSSPCSHPSTTLMVLLWSLVHAITH